MTLNPWGEGSSQGAVFLKHYK